MKTIWQWLRAKYYAIRDNRFVCFMLEPRYPFKTIKHYFWKRRVNKSIRILDELDWHFQHIGWNRQQRRRFWREFNTKQASRTAVLNKMTQE